MLELIISPRALVADLAQFERRRQQSARVRRRVRGSAAGIAAAWRVVAAGRFPERASASAQSRRSLRLTSRSQFTISALSLFGDPHSLRRSRSCALSVPRSCSALSVPRNWHALTKGLCQGAPSGAPPARLSSAASAAGGPVQRLKAAPLGNTSASLMRRPATNRSPHHCNNSYLEKSLPRQVMGR